MTDEEIAIKAYELAMQMAEKQDIKDIEKAAKKNPK